ncbi:unnamed protein product (macronuclear) [Paramecium tetraurelia]|uniref:Uncharacterized protein n=1 Tax=Paramecium tetraurelia TaxID=5888 RepID=A0CWB7_PARTE|nr:uncharacterized protein GSPATT00001286001 [Paramecium tetraurelia]CAK75084.1 unnamed protein product [Paramecium tetraurelia]|eukprot:XP_001442481.1 hypothetical protein (macronuclear) [Paramecium tetraurelia strain d4-2]
MKDQLRKETISPEPEKQKSLNFHRRFTSSQIESAGKNQISSKHLTNKISMQGLQQLLKVAPQNKVLQPKVYSQMLIHESFSQQYLKDLSAAYTPNQQATLQNNFFKKASLSQNSTMTSSIKPRMKSANKETIKRKSQNETTQLLSTRERDRQTIVQLQEIVQRTNSLLQQYQNEICRHIKEKEDLVNIIQQLQRL